MQMILQKKSGTLTNKVKIMGNLHFVSWNPNGRNVFGFAS